MAKKKRTLKNTPTQGKRNQRKARRLRQRQQRIFLVLGMVLIGVLVVAYAFWPRPSAPEISQDRLEDDPSRGLATAPVTITEFGDFGCESCRAWHEAGVLDQIQAQYGDQVRIVWRDLPIITAQSRKAAEAAQCAYDQGLFWEFHDILFARAPRLSVRELKSYATDLGLDMNQFNLCLDSGQHADTVERDLRAAFQEGLRGTPSFKINDQVMIGPSPQMLVQMIETALAAQ